MFTEKLPEHSNAYIIVLCCRIIEIGEVCPHLIRKEVVPKKKILNIKFTM